MRRENVAAYTEIRAPRWGKEESERTLAKRIPSYIHGTSRNCSLLHKVIRVEMRWWECGPGGEYLVRLQSPRLFAHCACGMYFRMDNTSSKVCESPKPDAVLCGMCHGQGRNFPHGKEHKIPQRLAKVRLGCVASGEVQA